MHPLENLNSQQMRTAFNKSLMYRPVVDLLQKAKDELIKGGEGARGGKIIGHTKSGHAIYDTNIRHSVVGREGFHSDFVKNHAHFNSEDHKAAAKAHEKEHDRHGKEWQKHYDSATADQWNNDNDEKGKAAVAGTKEAAAQQEKHAKLAKWHHEAAKEKESSK